MWQQSQSIPLQQGQYPNYAYNNNNNNNNNNNSIPQQQGYTQYNPPSSESPIVGEKGSVDVTIESCFKRESDGPILWFAGPPLNVVRETGPVHSLAYLDWKQQQKKQQINNPN